MVGKRAERIPRGGGEYRCEDQEDQESDAPEFFLAFLKLGQARRNGSLPALTGEEALATL